jgi:uncharacterized membrane protein
MIPAVTQHFFFVLLAIIMGAYFSHSNNWGVAATLFFIIMMWGAFSLLDFVAVRLLRVITKLSGDFGP